MTNLNLSPDKTDALLKMAGKKLGQSPDDIKSKLESGNLDGIIGGLDQQTQNKINSVLSNPQAMQSLMQNDSVKNLLSSLMGGQR